MSNTVIDIGAGDGRYMYRMAQEDRRGLYVILDAAPALSAICEKPENVFFLKWRSDEDSALPFSEGAIGQTHINFLMGEIHYREREAESLERTLQKYSKILREVHTALVSGGSVRILEPQMNAPRASACLENTGFLIIELPRPMEFPGETYWSAFFYEMFEKHGKFSDRPSESACLPTVLKAIRP